jgi:hypothetical protein
MWPRGAVTVSPWRLRTLHRRAGTRVASRRKPHPPRICCCRCIYIVGSPWSILYFCLSLWIEDNTNIQCSSPPIQNQCQRLVSSYAVDVPVHTPYKWIAPAQSNARIDRGTAFTGYGLYTVGPGSRQSAPWPHLQRPFPRRVEHAKTKAARLPSNGKGR